MNLKSLQLDNIGTAWGHFSIDSYLAGTSLGNIIWLLWQEAAFLNKSMPVGADWPEFPRITIDGPQWTLPDENS